MTISYPLHPPKVGRSWRRNVPWARLMGLWWRIWAPGLAGGTPQRTCNRSWCDRDAAQRPIDAAVQIGIALYVMVFYTAVGSDYGTR